MVEHSFIRAVLRRLPPELVRWKIHDSFAGGVPVAFYAGPGGAIFIEYKCMKSLPERDTTGFRVGLSGPQHLWLRRLARFRFPVAEVLGGESTAAVLTDKDWERPITRSDCIGSSISFRDLAEWVFSRYSGGVKDG